MTERELRPSALPPNPSVGELVTEIDRARHDAARTVAALAEKFDVKTRARRKAHDQLDALKGNGRRVVVDLRERREQMVEALPEPVARALETATARLRQVPVPVRVAAVVIVLTWLRVRRGR